LHSFIHNAIALDVPLDKIEVPPLKEEDDEGGDEEEDEFAGLDQQDIRKVTTDYLKKMNLQSEEYADARDEL